jgi:adenylate cyclase class 2
MLEAEVKLAIDESTEKALRERLEQLDAKLLGEHEQSDVYFAHPGRNFAKTDEALRLRSDDGELRITYKGPKLDPPRKTREEIELPLGADLATAQRLLERLGFRPVATVVKSRTEIELAGPPRVVVSIDRVHGLGLFCEIEVQTESVEDGRRSLTELCERLGVGDRPPIPESYLELLHR